VYVTEGPEHVGRVANGRIREIVGTHRDLVGRGVREALPELEGQPFFGLLDGVYATGEPFIGNDVPALIDRDGDGVSEEYFFNLAYQPLREADGTVYGIMVLAVEVTEQVRARQEVERKAEELVRLADALERSNRELDQFAYVASHDLKAPLRGIANLTQWIEEDLGDKVTGESAEHMRLLKGRVHRMEALIDGILTYSRAARTRALPEPVDTGALLAEVVDLLAPPSGVVRVSADMPTILAERVPLQQVLGNLVGNALKHGRSEAPRVEVTWRAAPDAVELIVRDNGPGIAPEFHGRIWGIFQTLEARDKVEGTGIGLAVVKKIVESRGGRVWVESALGAGAAFHVRWPTTTAHASHADAPAGAAATHSDS
jgi:signal transduction histidine kinase